MLWLLEKSQLILSGLFLSLSPSLFFFFWGGGLFWATPPAYGGSQARDGIGATVAVLHHSHSNAESESHL